MWKTVRGIAFGAFIIFLLAIGTGWNPLRSNDPRQPVALAVAPDDSVKLENSKPVKIEAEKIVPLLEDKALSQATLLVELGDFEGALTLIHQNENKLNPETTDGKKWIALFIATSEGLGDYAQLIVLHRHFPQAFAANEKASLLIGNSFISSHDYSSYEALRGSWKGRETLLQEWMLLDVDALLLNQQPAEAIKLLQSRTFLGKEESGRLVRLALLNIVDNPKAAWGYLTEAAVKDPQNPDIPIYRARLLESVGKMTLAQKEYLTALHIAPENIFLKDQLADFYLRNGQYQPALSIWLETLDGPTLDTIWLKTLFWSRMITPVAFDWNVLTPPSGRLQPFNRYLVGLPSGQFWDQSQFKRLPDGQEILASQQATFWLRLLDDLQHSRESQALELLQIHSPGKESWDPSLEQAIKQLLVYRKTGLMSATSVDHHEGAKKKWSYENTENPFFQLLNTISEKQTLGAEERRNAVSKELQTLLNSPEAFAVALISAGWFEAGLQLHQEMILPKEMPAWVAVVLTQAIQHNRGEVEALKYAMMQPTTPELSKLVRELLKSTQDNDIALEELKRMATDPSEVGEKASWMISLIYLERGDSAEAREAIASHPKLAISLLGRESLARIALQEGDFQTADHLYVALEAESPEAKSYLAQKAFKEKDWTKARALTVELLQLYPDNALLQQNLERIQGKLESPLGLE